MAHSTRTYSHLRQTEPAGGISFALLRKFVAEIRAAKPQLIHVRGLGNEGFHAALAAKIAGVPRILVSIHGTHRDLTRANGRWRRDIVANILEPLTLAMATNIATVCEFAASRSFLRPYRHKLIGAISNGVEIPSLSTRIDSSALKDRWGIPSDLLVGVCVSRITEEKGYPVLAKALAKLDQKGRKFAVIVVGGGDDDGRLRALFRGLANIQVVFVGHQRNVSDFLSISDFFLFPSLHENLSNALVEAMAFGLPAIATEVGGNTEVLRKGGGILIPANESEPLSSAIEIILGSAEVRLNLGSLARDNIKQNYSLRQMVNGWEAIYDRMLKVGNE